ncbi:MAG: tetratricopeptide repeat protein [Ferruginibacter sp.]
MLKRFLPFLAFLVVVNTAQAQKKNARFFYEAGMNFKQKNSYAEALQSFFKSVSFDKKFDSALVEIANIYSAAGRIDSAMYFYNKTLAINPSSVAALFGMGKIYRDAQKTADSVMNRKRLDTAIYFFNAAEALDKTNKEIYYGLAWIYNARKEHDKAIPYAVKSLEIDNKYKPAYGELGYAYRSLKMYAECIEQLKKNLAVSVVDVALLYSGYCYLELKNKEGAMQQYEGLLKVNERMAAGLKSKIDAAFPGN